MPIEVRELIIRTVVSQDNGTSSKGSGKNDKSSQEEIVKVCVAKVMEIIRNRYGR